jgi:hypothetical protein
MRWLFLILLLPSICSAEAMRIRCQTDDGESIGTNRGTCFSVGKTDDGICVIITAAHVVENATNVEIGFGGRWNAARVIVADPATDLAILECPIPTKSDLDLADASRQQLAEVWGFGPEYHGRKAVGFRGQLSGRTFRGDGGLHAITGDSGAPVVSGHQAFGVVSTIEWRASHRAELVSRDAITTVVPAAEVREMLAQYYTPQCGPNGCNIYLRPQIQQPRILGIIPTGPPRVVGVTPPIDSIGITTTPTSPSTPAPANPAPAITLDASRIREALEALAKERPDLFRGPAGPQGPAGEGVVQKPITIILARDGKEIDRETYQPGQPIILDVETLGGSR